MPVAKPKAQPSTEPGATLEAEPKVSPAVEPGARTSEVDRELDAPHVATGEASPTAHQVEATQVAPTTGAARESVQGTEGGGSHTPLGMGRPRPRGAGSQFRPQTRTYATGGSSRTPPP